MVASVVVVTTLAGLLSAARPVAAAGHPSGPGTQDTGSDRRCVVHLHGKSGSGGDSYVDDDGVTHLLPDGNAEGWGGRQWLYFPEDEYEAARDIVTAAVADCDALLLGGFSNGAAFVAKLYCRGDTLDDRLLGVVIDDPVPDGAVIDCDPAPGVRATLYWTGALESTARPGWDCSEGDWTCEGGATIGIDAYAEWLAVDVTDSPHDGHEQFWDAPELADWSPISEPASSAEATATPGTRA